MGGIWAHLQTYFETVFVSGEEDITGRNLRNLREKKTIKYFALPSSISVCITGCFFMLHFKPHATSCTAVDT